MNRNILIVLLIPCLLNCSTKYVDNRNLGNEINYGDFGFQLLPDENIFFSRKTIGLKADYEVSYYQHFEVRIPKNIKNWMSWGTNFIIEYEDNQIISIDPKTEVKHDKITDWEELKENPDLLHEISDYYSEAHRKKWDFQAETKPNRITKIFHDGHTKIILFNIKPENIETFSKVKNTFKYKSSNRR